MKFWVADEARVHNQAAWASAGEKAGAQGGECDLGCLEEVLEVGYLGVEGFRAVKRSSVGNSYNINCADLIGVQKFDIVDIFVNHFDGNVLDGGLSQRLRVRA